MRVQEQLNPRLAFGFPTGLSYGMDFKIRLVVLRYLNGLGLVYQIFFNLINHTELSDPQVLLLLLVPAIRRKTHDEASFQFLGPHLWNNLPEDLKVYTSLDIFLCKLKKHLFNLDFTYSFNYLFCMSVFLFILCDNIHCCILSLLHLMHYKCV